MAGSPNTVELRLRRSSVHRHQDLKRLDDGEDLNDALLDFFVKLGQAVIPCGGLEGGFPSVAYLGSHFLDVLRKGGVEDGRKGHANVANWARRRLGNGGLFFDGIGALAVPVNETLRDANGRVVPKEKHWWLAILLNPRGGSRPQGDEDMSMVCLDSVVRAEMRCNPPLRATRRGSEGYSVEVDSLYRQGFSAMLRIRARGDGAAGALADPVKSNLTIGGTAFCRPNANLIMDQRGSLGVPGKIEGTLDFSLDSTAPISGEYLLDFGDAGDYSPALRLSMVVRPNSFQKEVGRFLAGYVGQEWHQAATKNAEGVQVTSYDASKLTSRLCIPDVPQQETANDCGYFILAQILLLLQLTPEGLRLLAGMPADTLASLPWPTQREVTRRKVRLREAMLAMFETADDMMTDDVDVLLKKHAELRSKVQACMWDGPQFSEAVRRLAAASAPRTEYTLEDVAAMSTKALRTLCTQRGVLPPGMVERADLLSALMPTVVRPKTASSPDPETPSAPTENAQAPAKAGPASPPADEPSPAGTLADMLKRQAPKLAPSAPATKKPRSSSPSKDAHLGSQVFDAKDLETMPLKQLRGLCVQHGVLPTCALERSDFVRCLLPLCKGASGASSQTPAKAALAAAKAVAEAPTEMNSADRKARWAKAAAEGEHLAGMRFELADLEVMPLKILRALCVQYKVLPACAVERQDFVRALTPLAGKDPKIFADNGRPASASAPSKPVAAAPKKEQPRRDYSRFLGAVKPNFTAADLEDMPESTMWTLCLQHGVLPSGETSQPVLLKALLQLALPAKGAA